MPGFIISSHVIVHSFFKRDFYAFRTEWVGKKLLVFWKYNALDPFWNFPDQTRLFSQALGLYFLVINILYLQWLYFGAEFMMDKDGSFELFVQNGATVPVLMTDESQFRGDTISMPIAVKKWGWFLPLNPWRKSKLIWSWKINPQGTYLSIWYTTIHKGSFCSLDASWDLV